LQNFFVQYDIVDCALYLPFTITPWQVETVGRVYMAASGAPDRNENHAQNIADVSLQLIEHVRSLKLPSGVDIRIRIGNHPAFNFPNVIYSLASLET